jgi:hypothetical protein
MSNVSDTAGIVEAAILSQLEPRIINAPEGRSFLALRNGEGGWDHHDITSPNKAEVLAPKIITQAVQLQTVDALCAYIHRFKNTDSVLFADIATNTILGIIDYHTAAFTPDLPEKGEYKAPTALHTKHTAKLTVPHSLEWATWLGIDGKMMRHVDFSNFLEENALDILPLGQMHDSNGEIIEEAPTTILELCRELQVRGSYGASSEIRNGDYANIEMQKGDDVTTKRNVALPVSIDLNIPVYFGEQTVLVKAFLRRKIVEGSLSLGVKLMRPEAHRQDEFKRIVSEIEGDVQLTTLYGKPA